jgi:hypothetical protein
VGLCPRHPSFSVRARRTHPAGHKGSVGSLLGVTDRRRRVKPVPIVAGATLLVALMAACTPSNPTSTERSPDPADPTPLSTRVPSDECSHGVVIEWDGSPGPSTRAGAIQEQLDWHEQALVAGPQRPGDIDRTAARIAVRTLRAGLEALPDAEAGAARYDTVVVEPIAEDGALLGSIRIEHHGGGGYRVGIFGAVGFDTDGPQCTPG